MRAATGRADADPQDILLLLRSQTAAEHERMHQLPVFARLEAGSIELRDYRRLLADLLAFYRRFDLLAEQGGRRFGQQLEPYGYAPRSPRIESELRAVGCRRTEAAGEGPGWHLDPPASAAALGGMLYVVDGAMLGSSVLSRQIERFGAAGPEEGYWRWCRREAGHQWRTTRELLGRLARDTDVVPDMIDAARATFAAFGAGMVDPARKITIMADSR